MIWAARLAAMPRVNLSNVDSVDSVDSPKNRPIGTIGTIDNGGFIDIAPQELPQGGGAIGTIDTIDMRGKIENQRFDPDPIERAAIEAEAMPVRRLRARAAGTGQPQPGDFCGCCAGAVWWIEAEAPKGWRCCCCHPPAHLQPGQFRALAT